VTAIVVGAENFAFGPAAKAEVLVRTLVNRGHAVSLTAEGTALDLLRRSLDGAVRWVAHGELDGLLRASDRVVSVMDRPLVRRAVAAGVARRQIIWIDTLDWWWHEQPDEAGMAGLRIHQRSIGRDRDRAGDQWVGPILGMTRGRPPVSLPDTRDRDLLITFGGGEADGWYRYLEESSYPMTMCRLLLRTRMVALSRRCVVATNSRVIDHLASEFAGTKLVFRALAHEEFLATMRASTIVLSAPGLETPLECWRAGVPIVFLPPSNASQYHQLDWFRSRGLGLSGVHFRDLPISAYTDREADLVQRNRAFLELLREFEASENAGDQLRARLDGITDEEIVAEAARGATFIDALGGDGADDAVDKLLTGG
jgi:hypothetical protein